MDHQEKTVAYIIGNSFETLVQLPDVYTLNQFFSAILEDCLPNHRIWIVGQGISSAVREILSLCEKFRPGLHFHFGSLALSETETWLQLNDFFSKENETQNIQDKISKNLEWHSIQFVDANRVKADLKITNLSEDDLLTHEFLLTAARELCEKACSHIVPNGKLLIKKTQLTSFHRFFPLPITTETQLQLVNDNTHSLKSLTRFYQDYACIAEVNLSFDLHTRAETEKLLYNLGAKTFRSFSDKMIAED